MTDPAKDADPLDADACIDIATVIIDELDAIIATLEKELARVRQENLRLHGKIAAGELEHIAASTMSIDDIKTLSMQEAYWRQLAIAHGQRAVASLTKRNSQMITTERQIRHLIERQYIEKVEIVTRDGRTFVAIAYPHCEHPLYKKRRQDAYNKLDRDRVSLKEATDIDNAAANHPVAIGKGASIVDALVHLVANTGKEPAE